MAKIINKQDFELSKKLEIAQAITEAVRTRRLRDALLLGEQHAFSKENIDRVLKTLFAEMHPDKNPGVSPAQLSVFNECTICLAQLKDELIPKYFSQTVRHSVLRQMSEWQESGMLPELDDEQKLYAAIKTLYPVITPEVKEAFKFDPKIMRLVSLLELRKPYTRQTSCSTGSPAEPQPEKPAHHVPFFYVWIKYVINALKKVAAYLINIFFPAKPNAAPPSANNAKAGAPSNPLAHLCALPAAPACKLIQYTVSV